MMHPDMLLLAERLVTAMEAMSQDVKNMSAYVYDISCSVSYLLNERREKENISVEACDESDYPSPALSRQYEEADERPSSYMEPEHGDDSFGDIATRSIDPHENPNVFSSERKSSLSAGIKIEENFEVNNESCDFDIMYDDSRNNVRISEEVKCETQLETEIGDQVYRLPTTTSHFMEQLTTSESIVRKQFAAHRKPKEIEDVETSSYSTKNSISNEMISETLSETEGEDQACDLHPAISHSMEQLTRLGSIATIEAASNPVPREFQCVNSLSDSAANSNRSAYMPSVPEAEPLVSRTRQIESAEEVLMVHTRMESKKEPYNCSVCKKSFKCNSELERHSRVHSGERLYKCNECGKGFTQTNILTLHMRTHTGERPYQCNVCGKAFSQNSSLIRHMPSHTGQRPFSCDVCGKAFSNISNLKIHIRTHTGQKPYRCNICEKVFTQKSHLNTHMHTHWRRSIKV